MTNMKKYYILPKHLINKDNIDVHCDCNYTVHVIFSQKIKDELANWPDKKMKDILCDIKTSVEYAGLHRPYSLETMEIIYQSIVCTLNQIY